MKNFKVLASLMLVMTLVLGLSACSSGSNSGSKKVYKVVTEATFAPFEFVEDGSDEIKGFDVDMMTLIAEDAGIEIEFVNIEFDSLIPALESGQAEIICAGMNKLAGDRAQKADFGETYFESDLRVLVSKDSSLSGIDGLTADMKVASQIGTTGGEYAQEMADKGEIAQAVILNQWTDCYMQLKNGDVDAVFVDQPVGDAYLKKNSDIAKYAGDKFGDHEEFAFAVKKGDKELLDKLNAGLKKLKENGKYDELVDKWFN